MAHVASNYFLSDTNKHLQSRKCMDPTGNIYYTNFKIVTFLLTHEYIVRRHVEYIIRV